MGNFQAPMNDTGEDDMSPGPGDPPMANTDDHPLLQRGDGEPDMSPGPGETVMDQTNVARPTYNKNQTNESLGILGAGQPYMNRNK